VSTSSHLADHLAGGPHVVHGADDLTPEAGDQVVGRIPELTMIDDETASDRIRADDSGASVASRRSGIPLRHRFLIHCYRR
jgi:hypothetical protein